MKKNVYQGVREQIQELVRQGELQVGDKLPHERKLAETFKVSRNSVREALRALAEKNIVRSRRGDGTYICAPGESAAAHSLRQTVQAQRQRTEEIFEFRRLLEPQIAFLAAQNMSRKEMDQLKILVVDQETARPLSMSTRRRSRPKCCRSSTPSKTRVSGARASSIKSRKFNNLVPVASVPICRIGTEAIAARLSVEISRCSRYTD